MMMAFDSSRTPPSRLDDATIATMQVALRAYLANPAERAQLQRALTAVASEARTRDILPEHLLVALKGVWNALPEVRAIADANEQTRLLQRVVTLCIKEYYGS